MKKIQVLGAGPLCKEMAENAESAAKALGLSCEIEKITDIDAIISFGIMMTPALAIEGQVRIAGRVPSVSEIQKILTL